MPKLIQVLFTQAMRKGNWLIDFIRISSVKKNTEVLRATSGNLRANCYYSEKKCIKRTCSEKNRKKQMNSLINLKNFVSLTSVEFQAIVKIR